MTTTFSNDTVSVVVGGTSGIGAAVADALEERPGTVHRIGHSTGFDMTNRDTVADYFQSLGALDHLVVTAGSAAPGGSVVDLDIDAAKAGFDLKFWGSITTAKYAAPHLRPGGTVTMTSGFLSRRTVPGTYVKTAMNAGIEAVAKMLAVEIAPTRVNVVSPGLTDTQAYAGMAEVDRRAMLSNAAGSLPAGKVGAPGDLAQGYLAAIDNEFMTGAIIDVDGGALVN